MKNHLLIMKLIAFGFSILLISGCASYGVKNNAPLNAARDAESYSIRIAGTNQRQQRPPANARFLRRRHPRRRLCLRRTQRTAQHRCRIEGRSMRLLDEVDSITSVSGGSFTAAYYGLHGERIFDDFETVFLKRDVEGALKGVFSIRSSGLKRPAAPNWRPIYQKNVFHGATFDDMKRNGGPLSSLTHRTLATESDSRSSRSISTCSAPTWHRSPSRGR